MKKVKIAFYVIILGFVILVVSQNWTYFGDKQQFRINLFFDQYQTPEFSNFIFFLVCFLTGLLLAYLLGQIERYKSKKMIKKLNATTAAQHGEISGLKRELEMLQRTTTESGSTVAETPGSIGDVQPE